MSKSKKYKNKNKVKPVYKLTDYFEERFVKRFSEINLSKVEEVISRSKKYNSSNMMHCPYKVVKKKLSNPMYAGYSYLVNPFYNLILVLDNTTITNALYLDGTDGYKGII